MKLLKPFTSLGREVKSQDIYKTLMGLANVDHHFASSELCKFIFPAEMEVSYQDRHEAMNRLMQRLRKMGLAQYKQKKWHVSMKAWDEIQRLCREDIEQERKQS